MMNKDFAFASHLRDLHCFVIANVINQSINQLFAMAVPSDIQGHLTINKLTKNTVVCGI